MVSPCAALSSRCVMMSFAITPALAAGVSSIGATTLIRPSSMVTSMPRPPLATGQHLHVAQAVRIHVTRMRIEAGQHAVDRRFDELAVVRLFHVSGAHTLEHVAEQIKFPVSVRRRRTCGGTHQEGVGLRQQQCRHDADQCTEENQGSFAHHVHHGLESQRSESTIRQRLNIFLIASNTGDCSGPCSLAETKTRDLNNVAAFPSGETSHLSSSSSVVGRSPLIRSKDRAVLPPFPPQTD